MKPTERVSQSEPCYSPNTKNPANLAGFDRITPHFRNTYFSFVSFFEENAHLKETILNASLNKIEEKIIEEFPITTET